MAGAVDQDIDLAPAPLWIGNGGFDRLGVADVQRTVWMAPLSFLAVAKASGLRSTDTLCRLRRVMRLAASKQGRTAPPVTIAVRPEKRPA